MLCEHLGTVFFQEALALATPRDALGNAFTPLPLDGLENYKVPHGFSSCVPPRTYKAYNPFVAR